MGVCNLAIQKSVKIPDGIHIIYPSLCLNPIHFTPSLLLSLDDMMLSSSFLILVQNSYPTKNMQMNDHYLISPLATPDWIITNYPPIRLIVAGLDPLRDDQIW